MKALLGFAAVAVVVLGYGYYHAATHGWLHINLLDTAVKPYADNIRNAELRLLDGGGTTLAHGKSDDKFGVVRLIHPEAGDCAAVEQSATNSPEARERWQNCFQTLSKWLTGWAGNVRFADVRFADCDLKAVPVAVQRSSDWWLWWVPLPHIGGKPLTYFNLTIRVDGVTCKPIVP